MSRSSPVDARTNSGLTEPHGFRYEVRSLINGEPVSSPDEALFGGEVDGAGNVANHEVAWTFPPGQHDWDSLLSDRPGIWRYGSLLPVRNEAAMVSLGEGQTPLLRLERSEALAGHVNLYVKNEGQNPTWSHKDRLAAAGVSKALELGAKGVTVASTGNHAAATAAYAARAGLPCYVFTTTTVPEAMKALIQSLGAVVLAARDFDTRTTAMERSFREFGWWPIGNISQPPAGSNCFGVEGYKTIAYEIYEQFNRDVPEVVVLPTAYGDMTYGVFKGFTDLLGLGLIERLPRIVAVEPFGSLAESLEQGARFPVESAYQRVTSSFSTAAPISTYQALLAIRGSNGTAVAIRDESAISDAQRALGASNGLFVEAASATAIAAVRQLTGSGWLQQDDRVVCVLTSSGLKDPKTPSELHGAMPIIETSDPQHVRSVIKDHYGFDCEVIRD